MRRCLVLTALLLMLLHSYSWSQAVQSKQKGNSKSKRLPPNSVKLPIPDYDIVCNLSLWKGSFVVTKVTYDKDENQVVFLLRALRDFTFKDDGFESIKFFDEDDVDMIKQKNVKFDPEPKKGLKRGERTRAGWRSPMRKSSRRPRDAPLSLRGSSRKNDTQVKKERSR